MLVSIFKTFIYSLVGSVVIPWASSKLGIHIAPEQTSTLQEAAFSGAIGLGAAAAHWVHVKIFPPKSTSASTPSAPPPTSAKVNAALPFLAGMLLAAGSMVGLTGCDTLSKFVNSGSAQTQLVESAITLGAGAGIKALPALAQQPTAQAIIQAVNAIEAEDTDNQVTLSQWETKVAGRLAQTRLNDVQQAAINQAIGAAVNLISSAIKNSKVTGDEATSLNTVLNWIVTGVTPYAVLPAS